MAVPIVQPTPAPHRGSLSDALRFASVVLLPALPPAETANEQQPKVPEMGITYWRPDGAVAVSHPWFEEAGAVLVREKNIIDFMPAGFFGSLRDFTFSGLSPDDGAYWARTLVQVGLPAVLETAASVVETEDMTVHGRNTLSTIGNLVSTAIRRAILLKYIEANGWHLAAVAQSLHMGSDATPVLRAIRELGLTEEYEAAKRDGRVMRGGHRVRPPPSPTMT